MSEQTPISPETGTEADEQSSSERRDETAEERTTDGPVTTGAEATVAALEAAGADMLFGVQGGAIMPVYDALYDSEELRHVTMAHEQGAAHAADAYGIVSGKPGVCIATSGPGATNLVTGIADASMDSDPMVALTGQVPTSFVGNDAFQETDTVGVTQPLTKHSYFADDADTVGADVGEAFALAHQGRQGPTLVDLPKDVTQDDTDVQAVTPAKPDTYNPPTEADENNVAAAAVAIAEAERPVVLAGGGVIKADASEELRAFATEYEIPVITTMPGIGSFPEDHDLALEWAGMHGTGYANMAITNTDCLFAIGTRFDDRLTGDVATFAPDAEVIHVDIDPAEIGKNIETDHPLVGDAKQVITQVDDAMAAAYDAADSSPARYAEWREQCRTWKAEYPMTYDTPDDEPLKPQYVVERFNELADEDAVITTGVGQHQMWACQFWEFTEPRTWVSSHGLGTMGYGVPSAIGAKLAAPDQEVVCFDGDGSFLMTVQELSVAVREDLDVTYVVLNNEAVGMVRQWQDGFYEGRRMASEYPWIPQFDLLAEAFGARGFRLEDYEDVDEVIEKARNYDGPAVIDAIIDPAENVFPMVPSGGDNGLFALEEGHLDDI